VLPGGWILCAAEAPTSAGGAQPPVSIQERGGGHWQPEQGAAAHALRSPVGGLRGDPEQPGADARSAAGAPHHLPARPPRIAEHSAQHDGTAHPADAHRTGGQPAERPAGDGATIVLLREHPDAAHGRT